MNPNQRLSIMAFPQFFDGNELQVNIVVLPRDHNPLNPIIVGEAPQIPDAGQAFADASFSFGAQIIKGFGANPLPQPQALNQAIPLITALPGNPREIFEAMANHLQIFNLNMVNSNINLQNIPSERKFQPARPMQHSVYKHLPKTYLNATGIKSPRTKNAFTDDKYHCAVKAAKFHPGFQKSSDIISWGKVFAHILRQPLWQERPDLSIPLPCPSRQIPFRMVDFCTSIWQTGAALVLNIPLMTLLLRDMPPEFRLWCPTSQGMCLLPYFIRS
jgi:hypothetical protein